MEYLLGFMVFLGIAWAIFRPDLHEKALEEATEQFEGEPSDTNDDRFRWKVPTQRMKGDGRRILFERLTIAGTHHRAEGVQEFVDVAELSNEGEFGLLLLAAPENDHDENAIEIHGAVAEESWMLGFVPADIAEEIALEHEIDELRANLRYVSIKPPFYDLYFDILEPRPSRKSK